MSCPAPDFGYCQALVRGTQLVNGINNTTYKVTPVGAVQALLDPMNRADAAYDVQPGGSPSVRKIRVQRIPRGTYSEVESDVTCDVTTTAGIIEQCIEVNKSANASFTITNAEMEQYCEDAWAVVNGGEATPMFLKHVEFVNSKMNAMREYIDRSVIADLAANVGINLTTLLNTPTAIPVIQTADGSKIEKGIQTILFDMFNNQVYGTPLVIGAGNFDRFNTSANFGCCNQFGLNWEAMVDSAPYVYYRDAFLATLLPDPNQLFVLAPGAVQFVAYTNNGLGRTSMDKRHGDTLYGVLPDPFLQPIKYNIAVKEINCEGGLREPAWQISLYLHYDTVFLPNDAYAVGDLLNPVAGMVNGVFGYIAQQA